MPEYRLNAELENLPASVFELVDEGMQVESLTGGHDGLDAAGGARSCASCQWDWL